MLNVAKFLPKEEKFFRMLAQLSNTAKESAQHLKTFVSSSDTALRKKSASEITRCKADAKKVSAEVTRELCLTFITPFDREDLQDFSAELYKITKIIEKARECIELHKVGDISELAEQARLIVQESEAMESMVTALIKGGRPEQIIEKAELLDRLENDGDEVLSGLLVKLIENTQDARQLIIRKDIYDMLERVIDSYRNAAGVALQIALKHS